MGCILYGSYEGNTYALGFISDDFAIPDSYSQDPNNVI